MSRLAESYRDGRDATVQDMKVHSRFTTRATPAAVMHETSPRHLDARKTARVDKLRLFTAPRNGLHPLPAKEVRH